MEVTKVCRDCAIEKPISQYYKQKGGKHGVRTVCKPCSNQILYRYRKANPEKINAYNRKYWHKYPEKCRQWCLSWARNNPRKSNAKVSKRFAAKLQRIPKWANLEDIKQFYINCPAGYEVDHIIPLQGKNISGLHVLNNLQYLTVHENRSKGNRF